MLGKTPQNPASPGFELQDLIAQEEQYVFDSFTQEDARKLGQIMFDICDEYKMSFAFEIFLNNMIVFKYMPEGSGKLNDTWMEKKINTVMLTGWSTMRLWAMQEMIGKKRDIDLLPSGEYAMCGGGFPIRIKGAGLVGALICSGPGDQNDHEFCIEALKRFFGDK